MTFDSPHNMDGPRLDIDTGTAREYPADVKVSFDGAEAQAQSAEQAAADRVLDLSTPERSPDSRTVKALSRTAMSGTDAAEHDDERREPADADPLQDQPSGDHPTGERSDEQAEDEGSPETDRGSGSNHGDGGDTPPGAEDASDNEENHDWERMSVKELSDRARVEGEAFRLPPGWEENRRTIKGLTIDGPHTPDCDDMISPPVYESDGETKVVSVSVSDISSAVALPATRERAMRVGETVYRGTSIIRPMLHPNISEGALSVLEGQATPTVSRDFTFTEPGLQVSEPYLSKAEPTRMSYDDVDRAVRQDPSGELSRLAQLAYQLETVQASRGGVALWRADSGYVMGPEGRLVPALPSPQETPGQRIVQGFMTVYNGQTAQWMHEHEVPAIYRNYHFGGGISGAEAREVLRYGTLSEQRELLANLRAHPGATELSTTPTGHDMFGSGPYLRATSPLRRAEDTVNAANLAAAIEGKPFPFPADQLPQIIERIEGHHAEVRAQDAAMRARRAAARGEARRAETPQASMRAMMRVMKERVQGVVRGIGIAPELPSEYVENIQGELARGELPQRQIGEFILATPSYENPQDQDPGWATLTDHLLDYCETNPQEALSILNDVSQMAGGRFEFSPLSGDAASGTRLTGTLNIGQETSVEVEVRNAPNTRTAQQRASIMIMETLAGRRDPGSSYTYEQSEESQNPVSDLMTYYQRLPGRQQPTSSNTTTSSRGRSQNVTVFYDPEGNEIGVGRGSTRQEARRHAAQAALDNIRLAQRDEEG